MFRAYQSAAGPMTNPFLKHYWDLVDYENHRHRVRSIKAATDCGPPRTYMHMNIKLKKLQGEQERLSQIQKDNKIMLDRIADVMRGRGTFENHKDYEPKSLNCWKRQSQMVQLAYDNQIILRRIMDTHPEYNHNKLEDEFLLQQRYRSNIMKYPSNWRELVKQEQDVRKDIRESIRKRYAKFYKPKPSKGAGRSRGESSRGHSNKKDTSSDDSSAKDTSPLSSSRSDSSSGDSSRSDSTSDDSDGNDPPPGASGGSTTPSYDSSQRDPSTDDPSEEDFPSDNPGSKKSSTDPSQESSHNVSSLKNRDDFSSYSNDEILQEKALSEEIRQKESPVISDTEEISRNFTSDVQVKESFSDRQSHCKHSVVDNSEEKLLAASSVEQYLEEGLDSQEIEEEDTTSVSMPEKSFSSEYFEGKDYLSVLDKANIRDETSGEYLDDINDSEERLREAFQTEYLEGEQNPSYRSLREVSSVESFSDTYASSPRSQSLQKKSSIENFSDRLAALSSEIRASKEKFSFEYSREGKHSLGSFGSHSSAEKISLEGFDKKNSLSRRATHISLDRGDSSPNFSTRSSSEKRVSSRGSIVRSSLDTKEPSPLFTRRTTQKDTMNEAERKMTSDVYGQSSRDKISLEDVTSSSSSHSFPEKQHIKNRDEVRQTGNSSLNHAGQNTSSISSPALTT